MLHTAPSRTGYQHSPLSLGLSQSGSAVEGLCLPRRTWKITAVWHSLARHSTAWHSSVQHSTDAPMPPGLLPSSAHPWHKFAGSQPRSPIRPIPGVPSMYASCHLLSPICCDPGVPMQRAGFMPYSAYPIPPHILVQHQAFHETPLPIAGYHSTVPQGTPSHCCPCTKQTGTLPPFS